MSTKSRKSTYVAGLGGSSWLFWLLFAGVLGFFVYGQTFAGFLGAVLIAFIVSIVSVIVLIPILGPFLYWFWLGPQAINWGLQLAGLQPTWLTGAMQTIGLIFAIFLTAVTSFFAFMLFM